MSEAQLVIERLVCGRGATALLQYLHSWIVVTHLECEWSVDSWHVWITARLFDICRAGS